MSWSALMRLRCNILYHNLLCNMHNDIYFNKNDMDYTDDDITTFMSFKFILHRPCLALAFEVAVSGWTRLKRYLRKL